MMVNRGSEVYAHEADGTRSLLWGREASSEEDAALDRAADTVRNRLAADHGIEIDIIRNRLNRRKLDLIPTPEWADPPKARIGELLAAVEERLKPVPGGIGAVIDMTGRRGEGRGPARPAHHHRREARRGRAHRQVRLDRLRDAKARARSAPSCRPRSCSPATSSARSPASKAPTTAWCRASRRARRSCRSGASRTGCRRASSTWAVGRPRSSSSSTRRPISASPPPRRRPRPRSPPAPLPPPDGWVVERTGYDAVSEASSETLFALGERVHGDSRDGRRGRPRLGARRLRRGPLRRHDGRSGGPGGDRRLGRQRDLGRRPGPASVGVARPREHPPTRPPGAAPRAHAALSSIPTAARGGSTPSGS